MDDAYLGGARRGGKRGRGAAGKTPFVVAVETTIEGHPLRLKLNAVKGFRKAEIKKLSLRTLVPGTTVISDALAAFAPSPKRAAATDQSSPARPAVQIPAFKWVNTTIGNIKNAIRGTYHASPVQLSTCHVIWPSSRSIASTAAHRLEDMIPRLGLGRTAEPRPCPYRMLKSG